jgi:hypothetical protein
MKALGVEGDETKRDMEAPSITTATLTSPLLDPAATGIVRSVDSALLDLRAVVL